MVCVCLLVMRSWLWALQKRMNWSRCCLGCGLWGPRNHYQVGPSSRSHEKEHFFGGGNTRACPDIPVVNILLLIRKGGAAKYLIVDKPSRDVSDSWYGHRLTGYNSVYDKLFELFVTSGQTMWIGQKQIKYSLWMCVDRSCMPSRFAWTSSTSQHRAAALTTLCQTLLALAPRPTLQLATTSQSACCWGLSTQPHLLVVLFKLNISSDVCFGAFLVRFSVCFSVTSGVDCLHAICRLVV